MDGYPTELVGPALDAGNIGLWSFNIKTQEVVWSQNIKDIFEVEYFEGTYKAYLALIHPDDLDRVQQLVTHTIEARLPKYHVVHRTASKSVESPSKWIEAIGRLILDEEGEPQRLVGTVADITDRFLHETNLKEGQERLKLAIQAAGVGCYDWFPPENRLFWDQTMYAIFGMPLDFAGDKNEFFFSRLHEEDRGRLAGAMQAMMAQGESVSEFQNEYRVCIPDEPVKYVETWGRVFRDEYGNTIRLVGACVDITEKINMEEELQREKNRYQSVVETLGEGVVVYGLQGNVVECNAAAMRLLGIESRKSIEDQVIGGDSRWQYFSENGQFVESQDLPSAYTLRTSIPQRDVIIGFKKHDNNKATWLSVNSEPLYAENEASKTLVGVVTSFIDITLQKKKEVEVKEQNEELKKANQELDNFVYRVSHDLRAPLASSLGLIKLMQSKCSGDLLELLNLQQGSLKRMDDFIQDILHFARNSNSPVVGQPIAIKKLLQDTVNQLLHLDEFEPMQVELRVDLKQEFYSDPQRMQMILNNLISNAFRYRNPYIEESILQIWATGDGEHLAISIADNGLGIPEKHLGRIFEMFYRASDKKAGSGLGLYIVKEAVDKLQGNIFVESAVGEGTAFTVILPNLAPRTSSENTVVAS